MNAEDIQKNYEKHIKIIENYLTGDRVDKVKDMVDNYKEEYIMAPASTKSWYHNAFPGGYIDHVNRVVHYALKQSEMYEKMGGTANYTEEELVFVALFHDLGKLGLGDKPNYIKQTDKWRQDKLSEEYTPNPELDFMLIQDRSLFILQNNNINISVNEYIGIKIHDGMYDESNKPYYLSYQESSRLKSNLPYIIHTADLLASKVEYDKWKASGNNSEPKVKKGEASNGKTVKSSNNLKNLVKNL